MGGEVVAFGFRLTVMYFIRHRFSMLLVATGHDFQPIRQQPHEYLRACEQVFGIRYTFLLVGERNSPGICGNQETSILVPLFRIFSLAPTARLELAASTFGG